MSLLKNHFFRSALSVAMVLGVLGSASSAVAAIDWDQRRAEREAAREERRLEREARRNQSETEGESEGPAECTCSARLSFSKPALQFNGSTLQLVPKVDVDITSRGDFTAPGWDAVLAYEGAASYASDDVTVPAGVTFSGERAVFSGTCGSDYSFDGLSLNPVTLTGITRSLVGEDQRLDGTVTMEATLRSCSEDTERKQFSFTVKEMGNLLTRSWRTAK